MLWSVWLLLAMLVIVAGVFNVIWLSCVRTEARRQAESAVIAGGHAYLLDDMLRTWQQPFENEGRAVRSRNAVVDYLRQASDPSLAAIVCDGDVTLIEPMTVTQPGNTGLTQPVATVPNEIRVTYGKSHGND
jgi:alanine dehydrogenase